MCTHEIPCMYVHACTCAFLIILHVHVWLVPTGHEWWCNVVLCIPPLPSPLPCRTNLNPNVQNMKKIADLYAEVIGILSQSRFHSVKRRFFLEIRDTQNNSSTVISIIEGMSFIRVKMFPVEELEQWFLFLQVRIVATNQSCPALVVLLMRSRVLYQRVLCDH